MGHLRRFNENKSIFNREEFKVDPDSLDDAAKSVINLLKKEGYIE